MIRSTLTAALLTLATALPASAINITPGDIDQTVDDSTILSSAVTSSSIDFTNRTGVAITLSEIFLVGSGTFADLEATVFGIAVPPTTAFDSITNFMIPNFNDVATDGTLDPVSLGVGESFTIFFGGTMSGDVGLVASADVSAADIAPVPLPASLLPLLTILAGIAVLYRRRSVGTAA